MNQDLLKIIAEQNMQYIPKPFDTIVRRGGFDALCAITDCMSGFTIYIPRLRTILKGCLYEQIKSEFDGYNQAFLARKYEISERQVRKITN